MLSGIPIEKGWPPSPPTQSWEQVRLRYAGQAASQNLLGKFKSVTNTPNLGNSQVRKPPDLDKLKSGKSANVGIV